MKNKEELNAIKEEIENLNMKLAELNDEELEQVSGGMSRGNRNVVIMKARKLRNEGKITKKECDRLILIAHQEDEETYKRFASSFARHKNLSLDDIMF